MAKNVVIVESPAKAKTIERYLGTGYKVLASYGHVRDLPKSRLGIDVEHNYKPDYIIPRGSSKQLKALTNEIAKASDIYLATDYDREGEAIAWHILEAIPPQKNQKVHRITFTEITKDAVTDAINHPRDINEDLVNAQQARRVLDRLVGYSLSPVLWKKVRSGLSAGRVQSVAVKLIVDREREIQGFKPEEYWSLEAELSTSKKEPFVAKLVKIDGEKAEPIAKETAEMAEKDLNQASFKVANYETKPVNRNPFPPFITSSMQQDASRRLGFTARRTMRAAQSLYEDGHITYMRTDSYTISNQAQSQILAQITKQFGKQYAEGRQFKKAVRGAQEAHEAIRITNPAAQAKDLGVDGDQAKLYDLIWKRTLASQMAPARFIRKTIVVEAGKYELRASNEELAFDGFTKLYQVATDEEEGEKAQKIPEVKPSDKLNLEKLLKEQHFTTPPPRYNEASLIKKLEEEGIGRPSTYAPTISTIIDRGYIQREARQLVPQDTGFWVTDLLSKHFPAVVNEKFTAEIEEGLDDIAEGKTEWQPVVKNFYEPLNQLIKTEQIDKVEIPVIETDEICDVCGNKMVIKTGRFGQFMACSGFPACKNTKPILKTIGVTCPKDGGELIERRTKKGRTFYGCSNYPKCDYATWTKPKTPAETT